MARRRVWLGVVLVAFVAGCGGTSDGPRPQRGATVAGRGPLVNAGIIGSRVRGADLYVVVGLTPEQSVARMSFDRNGADVRVRVQARGWPYSHVEAPRCAVSAVGPRSHGTHLTAWAGDALPKGTGDPFVAYALSDPLRTCVRVPSTRTR